MQTMMTRAALAAAFMTAISPAFAEIVTDGGFEPPSPTATQGQFQSGFVLYGVGGTFGGPSANAWTVGQIGGSGGTVAVTPTTEYTFTAYGKTYFNANSGLQSMDLTGISDNTSKTGVVQTLATVAGGNYTLSFAVGNFIGISGSSVSLLIDGVDIGTYVSNTAFTPGAYNGDGVAGVNYQTFTYAFTAGGSATTIGFYNANNFNSPAVFLDDVSVSAAVSGAVPEPSTWAMMLLGFGGLAALSRRRPRSARATA